MKYISILATFTVDLKIDQAKLGLTNLILEVIDYVDESFLFNSIQLLLNLSHNPNVGKHFLKPEERKKLIYKIGVLMYIYYWYPTIHHSHITHIPTYQTVVFVAPASVQNVFMSLKQSTVSKFSTVLVDDIFVPV